MIADIERRARLEFRARSVQSLCLRSFQYPDVGILGINLLKPLSRRLEEDALSVGSLSTSFLANLAHLPVTPVETLQVLDHLVVAVLVLSSSASLLALNVKGALEEPILVASKATGLNSLGLNLRLSVDLTR